MSFGIDDDGMGFSMVLDGRIEFYQGVNAIRNRQGAGEGEECADDGNAEVGGRAEDFRAVVVDEERIKNIAELESVV